MPVIAMILFYFYLFVYSLYLYYQLTQTTYTCSFLHTECLIEITQTRQAHNSHDFVLFFYIFIYFMAKRTNL